MKRNGQSFVLPRKEIIVFPRGNKPEDFLDFTLVAIPDFEPFRKVCKVAPPPWSMDKKGDKKYNFDDSKYQDRIATHNKKFEAWIVINTIQYTEWLEWEKVKQEDPETWPLWVEEMQEAGIGAGERDRLIEKCQSVNSLNDQSIQEAMGSFLAMLRDQLAKSDSQQDEQASTSNTEPANVSDSYPQESESPELHVGNS